MTLSPQQIENTKKELKENYEKTDLTIEKISEDLGTSPEYINELFQLNPIRLEDTWILRNYLLKKVDEANLEPTPFTALAADWHDIWFLNADYIDNGKIL